MHYDWNEMLSGGTRSTTLGRNTYYHRKRRITGGTRRSRWMSSRLKDIHGGGTKSRMDSGGRWNEEDYNEMG